MKFTGKRMKLEKNYTKVKSPGKSKGEREILGAEKCKQQQWAGDEGTRYW